MKKVFAFVLAMVMLVGIFTGYGVSTTKNDSLDVAIKLTACISVLPMDPHIINDYFFEHTENQIVDTIPTIDIPNTTS